MTATQIPTPRTETADVLAAVTQLVERMQDLVFAGGIDTADHTPSFKVWPDTNPAYTADELAARNPLSRANPMDLIDTINAAAAHLARA